MDSAWSFWAGGLPVPGCVCRLVRSGDGRAALVVYDDRPEEPLAYRLPVSKPARKWVTAWCVPSSR